MREKSCEQVWEPQIAAAKGRKEKPYSRIDGTKDGDGSRAGGTRKSVIAGHTARTVALDSRNIKLSHFTHCHAQTSLVPACDYLLHSGIVGEGLLSRILRPHRLHEYKSSSDTASTPRAQPAAGESGAACLGAPELLSRLLDRPCRVHGHAVALLHLSAQHQTHHTVRK